MNTGPGSNVGNANNVHDTQNPNLTLGMGPITDKLINAMFDVITTKSFQDKISNKLINPLTMVVNDKIKPYVHMAAFLYLIIIILLIIIIYLIYKQKK
jgi:hypothetical protein